MREQFRLYRLEKQCAPGRLRLGIELELAHQPGQVRCSWLARSISLTTAIGKSDATAIERVTFTKTASGFRTECGRHGTVRVDVRPTDQLHAIGYGREDTWHLQGAIGLTKTMAFKRVFVHWAVEHF